MGDNVDVARALALVHVHTARALFFIILIILKAKLIFLIYLISTPRRASCKIYQNPRTKRAGFLGWVRLSHQHITLIYLAYDFAFFVFSARPLPF